MSIFKTYDKSELLDEYKRLILYWEKLVPKSENLKRNNIGYKCSNAFFQFERMHTPRRKHLSTVDFYKQHKSKKNLIQKAKDRRLHLQNYLQFLNHTPSQFPPNVAMWFYKKFDAKHVLDPFAGWGDRCIAAMAAGLSYTGIDSNPNLLIPFKNMIDFYSNVENTFLKNTQKIIFINDLAEKVLLRNNMSSCDFIFSSPPFWDEEKEAVEDYFGQHITNKYDFIIKVLAPIIESYRSYVPVCLYLNQSMAELLIQNGIKYTRVFSYKRLGNKKFQTYKFYVF